MYQFIHILTHDGWVYRRKGERVESKFANEYISLESKPETPFDSNTHIKPERGHRGNEARTQVDQRNECRHI